MTDIITITIDDKRLTPSQKKAIERIEKMRLVAPRDGYEFKRFEISIFAEEDNYNLKLAFVTTETGLIGDEGTMAAVFARSRYNFMIGKRGGIQSHDGNKWQKNLFRDSDWTSRNERLAKMKKESQNE